MIRPIIRTIISAIIKPIISDSTPIEGTRTFIETDPDFDMHYSYITTLTFASGDTFELDFTGTLGPPPSFYIADGEDIDDRGFIVVDNSTGKFVLSASISNLEIDGVNLDLINTLFPTDGKLHHIKVIFDDVAKIKVVGSRYSIEETFQGILANVKATIGGVTHSHALGDATGNSEQSAEVNGIINYVNIPNTQRELYQLSEDTTQWDNISPPTQVLPAVIEIA